MYEPLVMRKFLTSHRVAGKGISDSLPKQENRICESDRGLRNWAEFADFEAGAGDEIRTHDSLLGKQSVSSLNPWARLEKNIYL
jgi:hypothetical protein